MKKIVPLTLLVISILLSACAPKLTKDIQVEKASDPKVNLKAYKTYAWLGSASVLNDPEGKWYPAKLDVASEIKFLIDRELRSNGLSEVADQDAEVAISFFTGVDMEAKSLKADPKTQVEIPTNVPKAALIVVALDVQTGLVIWMGVATGDINEGATLEDSKARLDYAITKMFRSPRFYDSWFK